VLAEWLRVLKPGGRLILELPSMEKVFKYIANAMDRNLPISGTFSFLPLWGDPQFKSVAMCHKWGYFFQTLKQELVKAGFVDVSLGQAALSLPEPGHAPGFLQAD
jgi:ubiquinone/menaquinone biosynthesis C-methylase UbiE